MKVILATKNQGKISELKQALQPLNHSFQWVSMDEIGISSPIEDKPTFIENALLKARHCAHHGQLPSLADDSGLCVAHLQGQPSIYSARYAGVGASDRANCQKLLHQLGDTTMREAFFYCAIAYVNHASDPTPIIAEGYWQGRILTAP